MRDIVPKVSANHPQEQRHEVGKDVLHYMNSEAHKMPGEIFTDQSPNRKADVDEESVGSQDSGASVSSIRSDLPNYQSYRQYLDAYNTKRFKPVKMANTEPEMSQVDGGMVAGKPHSHCDDARVHKAEIMIQVRPHQTMPMSTQPYVHHQTVNGIPSQTMPVPPPPPPFAVEFGGPTLAPPPPPTMPKVLPSKIITHVASTERGPARSQTNAKPVQHDLKTCLMDELKAKHAPKEYPFQQEVEHAFVRRTSEPINAAHTVTAKVPRESVDSLVVSEARKVTKPPLPSYPVLVNLKETKVPYHPPLPPPMKMSNDHNSLPRRWSEHHQQTATMLANPDAQTVTKVPTARRDAPVDRDDPNVKKLVYATLRNYVGAYNNHANKIVAQNGHAVQDKGVTAQINRILASGNMGNLNGRINPKASE